MQPDFLQMRQKTRRIFRSVAGILNKKEVCMNRRIGLSTMLFRSEPRVLSSAAVVAKNENEGTFGGRFDMALEDDKFGEDSFERAECKIFCTAAKLAVEKAGLRLAHVRAMLAGDLLNQLITANYAARELGIPYLGLYGACSTMAESLLLGSMLVDGGYCAPVLCCASSHFSTAERQYRFPLEMGTTAPPTAQHTVTGAGALLLSDTEAPSPVFSHIAVTAATIGRVIDLGITDMNNMGAAMAPASVILTPCPRRPKNAAIIGVFGISCCRKEVIFRKIFGVM